MNDKKQVNINNRSIDGLLYAMRVDESRGEFRQFWGEKVTEENFEMGNPAQTILYAFIRLYIYNIYIYIIYIYIYMFVFKTPVNFGDRACHKIL